MDPKQPNSPQDAPKVWRVVLAGSGTGQLVSGGDGGVTLRAMMAQMGAYQAIRNEPPTVPKPRRDPDSDRLAVNRHERRVRAAQLRRGALR